MARRTDQGPAIAAREITPEALYNRRRDFLRGGAALAVGDVFFQAFKVLENDGEQPSMVFLWTSSCCILRAMAL